MERVFTNMYLFDFTKNDTKTTLDLDLQGQTRYIAIKNQNYGQEIILNVFQDPAKKGAALRLLIGKFDAYKKNIKFEKLMVMRSLKESVSFPGGDIILFVDSN